MATTYYVDVTTGNDSDTGLTEALAWATLEKAADTATTAGDLVYVKASADYVVQDGATGAVMNLGSAGTSAAWISYEGYTTTPGDNGVVTINAATNSLANCVNSGLSASYYTFKNFRFTGASAIGFSLNGTTGDYAHFNNCEFDNNGSWGFSGDDEISFFRCSIHDNGGAGSGGADMDYYCFMVGCKIYGNRGTYGVRFAGRSFVDGCLFYDNSTGGVMYSIYSGYEQNVITNCVFDGFNQANSVGININGGNGITMVKNNIFYDLNVAVTTSQSSRSQVWDYNLYYDNNTNYGTAITQGDNDIIGTGDPFTDSSSADYTLADGSEAINAGFDLSVF